MTKLFLEVKVTGKRVVKKAGDLIILINELKSKKEFVREGENLLYTKKIDLVDALCGCEFIIRHLDNRMLKINTKDYIIQNNQHMKVKNEGMKKTSEGLDYGDLIIKFIIKFLKNYQMKGKIY